MPRAKLNLGSQVLDKGLVTRDGYRAGKVDDLMLELDPEHPAQSLPEVCAIITGPLALALEWPRPLRRLARWFYRLLGLDKPEPVIVPWREVSLIQAVIHLNVDRDECGLHAVADAVNRRFIARIPGS